MSEKLKPCPFCGGEGYIFGGKNMFIGGIKYFPRCRTKDCVGNNGWVGFNTEYKAIKAWNRRAKTQQQIEDDELAEAHRKGEI